MWCEMEVSKSAKNGCHYRCKKKVQKLFREGIKRAAKTSTSVEIRCVKAWNGGKKGLFSVTVTAVTVVCACTG